MAETKRIAIDNGATLVVERGRLEPEITEAMFQLIAFIAGIHDNMALMKGTPYYSAGVVKELDRYADTKLRPIFKQKNAAFVADATVVMTQTFTHLIKGMYQLSKQPESVQLRFDRKLDDLFIESGVYMPDYEPIKIT